MCSLTNVNNFLPCKFFVQGVSSKDAALGGKAKGGGVRGLRKVQRAEEDVTQGEGGEGGRGKGGS